MKTNGNEPITFIQSKYNWESCDNIGLTKREYFAAMALQGLCANHTWTDHLIEDDWEKYKQRLTSGSVEIADSLIEALNKE